VPIAGLTLVQEPPLAELVNVVVWPAHTLSVPPIAPGKALTVTTTVDGQVPADGHVMVAVPADTPPTRPGLSIDATNGLLLDQPPALAQVSDVVKPTHKPSEPSIGAELAFTVTTLVT
jgi:hypothetical protein